MVHPKIKGMLVLLFHVMLPVCVSIILAVIINHRYLS